MVSDGVEKMNNTYEIKITYNQLTMPNHQIDLGLLAESLKGFDRIISTIAHFEQTGEFAPRKTMHQIKVYAHAAENNCFSLKTIIDFSAQHALFSGLGVAVVGYLINYLFSKRGAQEMKYLNEALQKLIDKQERDSDRLLSTIDRLVDALTPAAKQALTPIGKACEEIVLSGADTQKHLNSTHKENLEQIKDKRIDESRHYTVLIRELDLIRQSAKVLIDGDNSEHITKARITDPALQISGNLYARSLADCNKIKITAKAEIVDGEIKLLHISDAQTI